MADDHERRVYDTTHTILERLDKYGMELDVSTAEYARHMAEHIEDICDRLGLPEDDDG